LHPFYRIETAWELSSGYQESYDVKEQMDQVVEPLKKSSIHNKSDKRGLYTGMQVLYRNNN
jgi:hypothetical protein